MVFIGKSSQFARLAARLGLNSVTGIELAPVLIPTVNVDLLAFGAKSQISETQSLAGTIDTAALGFVVPDGKVWVLKNVFRGACTGIGVVIILNRGVRGYLHKGAAQYSGGGGIILGPGDAVQFWNTGNAGDSSIPCSISYTQEENYLNMEE